MCAGTAVLGLRPDKMILCRPGQAGGGRGWQEGKTAAILGEWEAWGVGAGGGWEDGSSGLDDLGQILTPVPGLTVVTWATLICTCEVVGTDSSSPIGLDGI